MRYRGKIGVVTDVPVPGVSGVYRQLPMEIPVVGDVTSYRRRWDDRENQNADVSLTTKISIVSSGMILQNLKNIRYAVYRGVAWKVESIEDTPPRLILTLGGAYDGYTENTVGPSSGQT